MAIKTYTIANFSQSSTWRVDSRYNTMLGDYENYLVSGPSTVSVNKAVVFSGIPAGSTINSAVLTATIGGTAFKIRQLDDVNFSGSRNVISKVAPGASVNFKFTFQGSGSLSTVGTITSSLAYSNIKITVDYTEPASGLTLNKTSCKAGDVIRATIAPTSTTAAHKIRYAMTGVTTVTSATIPAGTKTYDYTVPLSWQNAFPNNASRTVTVTLLTYSGSTNTGEVSKTFSLTLSDDAYPSITQFDIARIPGFVDEDITEYIQGFSQAQVQSAATGAYSSTISQYKVTVGGWSGTGANVTSPVISGSGNIVVTLQVTDSRGRKATQTQTIAVLPYSPPSLVSPSVYRSDVSGNEAIAGTYVRILTGIRMSPLGGPPDVNVGTLKARVYEKGTTAPAWDDPSVVVLTANTALIVGGMDIVKSYTIDIQVSDKLASYVYTAEISTAKALISGLAEVAGVAIGKYAETPGVLDIAYSQGLVGGNPLAFYPIGAVYISTVSTNPGNIFGGTWSALATGKALVGVDPNDSDFTAGVAGGSKTGAVTGIAKLGVSSTSLWVKRKSQTWNADGKGTLAGSVAANSDNLSSGIELDATASTLQPYLPVYIWTRTA